MRQALIEKESGRMYLSPEVGTVMMYSSCIKNDSLMIVGEEFFEDTWENRKVDLLITSYNTMCGAFFQVVIEERGSVVYAETFESYWDAYRAWNEWAGFWSSLIESFFKNVVRR